MNRITEDVASTTAEQLGTAALNHATADEGVVEAILSLACEVRALREAIKSMREVEK